jgi:hypothetical protein
VQRAHILKALAPSPTAPEREVIDLPKINTHLYRDGMRLYFKSNIDFGYAKEKRARKRKSERKENGRKEKERRTVYFVSARVTHLYRDGMRMYFKSNIDFRYVN